jgi:hypothetical protein
MRKTVLGLALGAIMAFGTGLSAETKTVTGTLVDVMCHTKMGAKATEPGHAGCAAKCAKGGEALVVVTDSAIYQVTGAWTANDNEKLVEFAGQKVQVTGNVSEKDGKPALEVTSIAKAAN